MSIVAMVVILSGVALVQTAGWKKAAATTEPSSTVKKAA
jgi:hypothetical protein